MTKVSSDTISAIIGPQYVGGMSAGFEAVEWNVKGETDINSSSPTVEVHLNEKSLQHAEKCSGVSRTPDPKSKVTSREQQADEKYDSMFQKRGISPTMPWRFGGRNDYRRLSMAKGPIARMRQRRMLELRRTFDQIAALKTKTVAINPEMLPHAEIEKMVREALANGKTQTPLGSIERTMRFVGRDPQGLRKAFTRWEHALFPGSVDLSGPSIRGDS